MDKDGIQQKDVSARTVSCFLNSQNYYYLQTRKKGLMTAEDHIKRVKIAKYMKANYSQEIWRGNCLLSKWNRIYAQKKSTRSGLCTKSSCLEKEIGGFMGPGCIAKGQQRGDWGQSIMTDGGNFLQ